VKTDEIVSERQYTEHQKFAKIYVDAVGRSDAKHMAILRGKIFMDTKKTMHMIELFN